MYWDYHTHQIPKDVDVKAIVNYFPNEVNPETPFSVGIHPCYISEDWQEDLKKIEHWARNPNCYAIGECGLDRLSPCSWDLQTRVFEAQIQLSERHQKPLTIHCVKAYSEIIFLKKKWKPQQEWVIHGFRKNEKVAQSLLEYQIKLSFGKALLYDSKLQKVFQNIPENSYYLETDDATDISIKDIYQKARELRIKTITIRI